MFFHWSFLNALSFLRILRGIVVKKAIGYHYMIKRLIFSIISSFECHFARKKYAVGVRWHVEENSTPPTTENAEKWKKLFPRSGDVASCIIKWKKFLI